MRSVLAIARKDLRQRIRDRSAIVIGVVAPIIIAAIMSVAFGASMNFHFKLGVVNSDRGPLGAALLKVLDDPSLRQVVAVEKMPDVAAARAGVKGNKIDAALVVPAGFSAAATTSAPEAISTLTSVDKVLAGDITAAVASSFVAQLNADRLAVVAVLTEGGPHPSQAELTALASQLRIPLQSLERPLGARQLTPISYFSPAMAIFFLLFMVSFASRSFFTDKSEGMVERMLAAPVRPVEIIAGKALAVLVFGLLSIGVIAAVTSLAFGADWGAPLGVALVCVSLVLSVVALTALVIGLSRTQRQAEGIASLIVFGLALLGGNFVFLSAAPPLMRRLALGTPNGWALRGFTDLVTNGSGVGAVIVPVLAILAFTAVVGVASALLAPRAVR